MIKCKKCLLAGTLFGIAVISSCSQDKREFGASLDYVASTYLK